MSYLLAAKNAAIWFLSGGFLLKEDGFYLLLETGDKIVLNGFGGKNTSMYTNVTKN